MQQRLFASFTEARRLMNNSAHWRPAALIIKSEKDGPATSSGADIGRDVASAPAWNALGRLPAAKRRGQALLNTNSRRPTQLTKHVVPPLASFMRLASCASFICERASNAARIKYDGKQYAIQGVTTLFSGRSLSGFPCFSRVV